MEATVTTEVRIAKPRERKVVASAVLIWLGSALAASAMLGLYRFSQLGSVFEADARTVHRVLSQRADQHDALLTSLAAVVASTKDSAPTLRPIADSVLRFYPRITAIEVVEFQPSPALVFSTRDIGATRADPSAIAAIATGLQPGQTALRTATNNPDYAIVKRIPTGAIVMTIDGQRLADPDDTMPPGTNLVLRTPDGRALAQPSNAAPSKGAPPGFSFEKELGSRSQPLDLQLQRRPELGELFPATGLAAAFAGTGLALLLGWLLINERRTAREASRQAAFHAQDARFAHAARVNTVGEMASGIAHELTQPLTAILSQSQAGLRLARGLETPPEIVEVLEANARGAKRAGDILARLREYIANRAPAPQPTPINDLVRHVIEIVRPDLDQKRVMLTFQPSTGDPRSMIDRISIEQVVHNLLLNAIDAIEGLPEERRAISITTDVQNASVVIAVHDRGEGISPDDLPRLFEPFFTTKAGGMGLGLPICERLVESFGGRISAANDPAGGAILTVRLPALT